ESRETPAGAGSALGNVSPHKRSVFTLAKTLAMGQGLAGLICGTAITSQFLASNFHVNTPMLQSFLNYLLLTVTYTTMLLCRTGDGNFLQILKRRWWKYLLLGLVDVEANYTVVKAYQYTTITSIQVSRLSKFISVCYESAKITKRHRTTPRCDDLVVLSSASNILLGDGLVLLSASLYAVSNVCQEYTVKNLSRVEFLGMVGLFGTIISTIQMTAVRCLCTVYVCSVQLHAYSDKAKQRHLRQPLPAHR
uniref:Solute carrier family 35 member F2 n=1 Tax=Neolamprologus brichardi TaxID=32507 RepID=A0A3Q4MVU5_NEOBR